MESVSLRVLPELLRHIHDNKKDLEVRVARGRFDHVCTGQILIFNGWLERRVARKRSYWAADGQSFSLMLEELKRERIDLNRVWPGHTEDEILAGLRKFYPAERESRGVIVFELEAL